LKDDDIFSLSFNLSAIDRGMNIKIFCLFSNIELDLHIGQFFILIYMFFQLQTNSCNKNSFRVFHSGFCWCFVSVQFGLSTSYCLERSRNYPTSHARRSSLHWESSSK